jgi:serine/threonine protein kinase
MAPEYLAHGLVTPKLDVFSFGVVMLELLSGKPAVLLWDGDVMLWTTIGGMIEGSNRMEKLKGLLDLDLKDDYLLEMAFAMARLARTCVHEDLTSRPTISEIQMALSTWLSAPSPSSLE